MCFVIPVRNIEFKFAGWYIVYNILFLFFFYLVINLHKYFAENRISIDRCSVFFVHFMDLFSMSDLNTMIIKSLSQWTSWQISLYLKVLVMFLLKKKKQQQKTDKIKYYVSFPSNYIDFSCLSRTYITILVFNIFNIISPW